MKTVDFQIYLNPHSIKNTILVINMFFNLLTNLLVINKSLFFLQIAILLLVNGNNYVHKR